MLVIATDCCRFPLNLVLSHGRKIGVKYERAYTVQQTSAPIRPLLLLLQRLVKNVLRDAHTGLVVEYRLLFMYVPQEPSKIDTKGV